MKEGNPTPKQGEACGCFNTAYKFLVYEVDLGMDENYAEINLLRCTECDQRWLRYFYEQEAFTASGRWYLGAISTWQASLLTAQNAKSTLESLGWYFYGGSLYDGKIGLRAGKIDLFP